ncbi:MAG TPA: Rieske 2Fe-2S domain-containing protein [Gemmatales bacterium]|nr:Rieske 2Fe-2S domain-containing protein [Gemmatales bacterium]HMP60250.1 Rieske 2Fe-2S domain-containing protein [Gemmatales bacterium]
MPEFRTLARVADVPEGQAKAFPVGPKSVAIFNQAGTFFAIDDLCPHMGASLANGVVRDGVVACTWHGWRFRLHDGCWMNSPKLKIGRYPVRVVGDEIQVEI